MSAPGLMPGVWPATVVSYDQKSRKCRVSVPGITDGGGSFPNAEILYPIGDKSKAKQHATEIEILKGDSVWVAFIGGDPRCPLIIGYRNPGADNSKDWRQWHHKNISLLAEDTIRIKSGDTVIHVKADGSVEIKAKNIEFTSDSFTHNGKNVGATHRHGGVEPGSGNTGEPS